MCALYGRQDTFTWKCESSTAPPPTQLAPGVTVRAVEEPLNRDVVALGKLLLLEAALLVAPRRRQVRAFSREAVCPPGGVAMMLFWARQKRWRRASAWEVECRDRQ